MGTHTPPPPPSWLSGGGVGVGCRCGAGLGEMHLPDNPNLTLSRNIIQMYHLCIHTNAHTYSRSIGYKSVILTMLATIYVTRYLYLQR